MSSVGRTYVCSGYFFLDNIVRSSLSHLARYNEVRDIAARSHAVLTILLGELTDCIIRSRPPMHPVFP